MDDYNRYVTAVNKIFDYLEKLKAGWNNVDNKNYIDSIDEFKSVVTSKADEFKKPPTVTLEKTSAELEEEQAAAQAADIEKQREIAHQQVVPPPPSANPNVPAIPEMPMNEITPSFQQTPSIPKVEALGE